MKAKIIIVEDHESIRNELKILLSKYGYEIIVLDRFDTVVEDCLREDVDLILLDINLPFYDGYYVCRAIREKSEVPIIVVTSRDSEMDEQVLSMGPKRLVLTLAIRCYVTLVPSFSYVLLRLTQRHRQLTAPRSWHAVRKTIRC